MPHWQHDSKDSSIWFDCNESLRWNFGFTSNLGEIGEVCTLENEYEWPHLQSKEWTHKDDFYASKKHILFFCHDWSSGN